MGATPQRCCLGDGSHTAPRLASPERLDAMTAAAPTPGEGPIVTNFASNQRGQDADQPKAVVYVVEDQASAREALVDLLSGRNYRCKSFATAEEFPVRGFASNGRLAWCSTIGCPASRGSSCKSGSRVRPTRSRSSSRRATPTFRRPFGFMERGAVTLLEKPFSAGATARGGRPGDRVRRDQPADPKNAFQAISESVGQLSKRERIVLASDRRRPAQQGDRPGARRVGPDDRRRPREDRRQVRRRDDGRSRRQVLRSTA